MIMCVYSYQHIKIGYVVVDHATMKFKSKRTTFQWIVVGHAIKEFKYKRKTFQ